MTESLFGISIPFRIDGGGVRTSAGRDKLGQNVKHLLTTRIGERLMRRDYGGGVHGARDELNTRELVGFVRHELESALQRWLPEIRVEGGIDVRAADNKLLVTLRYRPVAQARLQVLSVEI